jgi:16S rRNA (cytidine1402-2'-O)-methyltransferase
MTGRLTVCATPIGNLGDAPPRLAEVLQAADLIYVEDTRHARKLLDHLAVDRPVRSYFIGNEATRQHELAEALGRGSSVALITDAGTPSVADPGVTAVRAARSVGADVSVVPGPSAVTAVLAASGFGADRFVFEGFLPKKAKLRSSRLVDVAAETRTVVLFSVPHRVVDDLSDLSEACGPTRQVCVARELTKRFEEIWWGSLSEAIEYFAGQSPRGEFTIAIEAGEAPPVDLDAAVTMARRLVEQGRSRSEAAREAAHQSGAHRREIYERM